jgi:serine phosphatase RsbU (regulator of sigma subunit)
MIAVYGILILLCVAVMTMAHVDEHRRQREQALELLGSVTSTLAVQLNGEHVDLLRSKYQEPGLVIRNTQDAWYYVMHDHLRKAAERLQMDQGLQVLAFDSSRNELQVIVTSDIEPRYRAPYSHHTADILAHYEEGALLRKGRDSDEQLIAFDVLRNEAGQVSGIVLGSISGAAAAAQATATLWRNMLFALLLFVLAGIALFTSAGRWLQQDNAAHQALQQRHAGIADSIAYAGKIQRALAPPAALYDELFKGAFIIDRPKDMVSGDFHWVHRVDEHTCYVAAADCTGHGLPGAMIAAIGCSLLNEVVPNHADKDPAELLSMLNTRLVTTLHQQGQKRGAGDGMDMALCRVDRRAQEILFAGAHRPLYWLHGEKLTVINGDRKPVGGSHQQLDRRYTVHRLAYTPGDRIYLFSDGYVDQFGGPEGKRFMSMRLHALLSEHRHLDMAGQRDMLERAYLEWKGTTEQVDDVCVLGLAV